MFFLLFSFFFLVADLPLLTPKDVPYKLRQVTHLHANHKKIDASLIARSLKLYIELLDPEGFYLEKELTKRYLTAPLEPILEQFLQGNLTVFEELYDNFVLALRTKGGKGRSREASFLDESQRERHICYLVIKAMAAAFDSHTRYFSPEEAEELVRSIKQQFYGIGVQIRAQSEGFEIVRVYKEGPAFGQLQEGDVIVAIDDERVVGYDVDDVVRLLKSREKKIVKLTLISGVDISLVRGQVLLKESNLDVQAIATRGGVIARVRLGTFYEGASLDVERAIRSLGRDVKGVILDMRGNMGGLLSEAISLAGLFLDPCAVVAIKEADSVHIFRDREGKNIFHGPLIIIVDRFSASASELVAQTLQDWGRAIVVGERTYGKGTYQLFTLDKSVSPQGEFKVTMGSYYTSSGRSVQIRGVCPDIEVKGPFADLEIGEVYTTYPLEPSSIDPLFEDGGWLTRRGQQRLVCFSRHIPALKMLSLAVGQEESGLIIMHALIDKVSVEERQ